LMIGLLGLDLISKFDYMYPSLELNRVQ
jgi:hypothetical protein